MGSPITVKFYANIDRNNPDETIIYDFKSFGEDMDLIRNNEEKYCLKLLEGDILSLVRIRSIGCLFMGISLLMYVSDENEYYQYIAGLGTGIAVLGASFLASSKKISKKMLCEDYPGIINIVDQGMRNGFNEGGDPVPTLQ